MNWIKLLIIAWLLKMFRQKKLGGKPLTLTWGVLGTPFSFIVIIRNEIKNLGLQTTALLPDNIKSFLQMRFRFSLRILWRNHPFQNGPQSDFHSHKQALFQADLPG